MHNRGLEQIVAGELRMNLINGCLNNPDTLISRRIPSLAGRWAWGVGEGCGVLKMGEGTPPEGPVGCIREVPLTKLIYQIPLIPK